MKKPIVIIIALFLLFYYAISQLNNNDLTDEALIFDKNNPPSIIMFGSQSCHYCTIARSFFNQHNLPYTENDIDLSLKHRDIFYRLGGQGTPLIIANKTLIHGFDEKQLRQAVQKNTKN